jgi:hypothetical protein
MDLSPNLRLPYIAAAQAQKHVTHNEAVRALDAMAQLGVVSRAVAAPPPSPADGDRYLLPAGASGAWSGHDGKIAAFQDGAWAYYIPRAGWVAWIAAENALVAFDGAAWQSVGGSGAMPTFQRLGIQATPDDTNRLAVTAAATLLNHAGNGHQLKINKAAAADTASLLFQTGFSGRAEMGLMGDDNWRIKVSPDGATWFTTLQIDRNTGRTGLNIAPLNESRLRVGGAIKADGAVFLTGSSPATWSTFWGGTESNGANGLMFASNYGYLGSNGSFKMGLYWNGFRNTTATWTSLGINGSSAACAVEVGPNGIDFASDTSVAGASPTVRMRFSNAGSLGIGTAALSPSAQLHTTGSVRFAAFGAGSATFDASGNVSSSSDERLKQDIAPFTRGLAAVLAIQPISYRWNLVSGLDTLNRYVGLSAQNVEAAIPEAIGIDARGYLSLQDRPIIAALVNAVRELDSIVARLDARIAQLETT